MKGESATGGAAVLGIAGGSGPGIHGQSPSAAAPGVLAENTKGAVALAVYGIATFSRSGSLHLAAGAASKSQTLAGVTTSSLVLATLQKDAAGVYIQSAVPHSGRFTINLNQPAPTGGIDVGWLVLN